MLKMPESSYADSYANDSYDLPCSNDEIPWTLSGENGEFPDEKQNEISAWRPGWGETGQTDHAHSIFGEIWKKDVLPESFDVREAGKEPVIKSQGQLGTCWALTATSALEAALMPRRHEVFSADHLSLNNGFVITQDEGGDYMMAMAYLSGWYGPVLESEDPYGDGYSPDGLSARVHVQEMQLLAGMDRPRIKRMIYEYGPVQTSLYLDRKSTARTRDYYNEEHSAYLYPQERTSIHDVLILGWDDSFPKEYFKIQPSEDGAYICQNTWGESFGENGIFYVSYEDANIARTGIAYTKVEPADNYGHIYQTDVCGWQGRQGYEEDTCYFANVYTAENAEYLEAAGFYTTDRNSSYQVYVIHHFAGIESFDDRILCGSGFLENSGYYTVNLTQKIPLEEGERFAVMVKITTPGATKPVVVELKKDVYSENVTLEGKEGYISYTGEIWEPTEERFGTNVCLKAYTQTAMVPSS